MQMSKPPSSAKIQEVLSQSSSQPREIAGTAPEMEDSERAAVTIARLIDQLHAKKSSEQEKELSTARLLGLARGREESRKLIGCHPQALPAFMSLLRNGTHLAKLNVAAILSVLCKDETLRSKVLIGGCVPPLLSLLKSESIDARKAAAEAIYEVSSYGMSDDNVGTKIFLTEGVVSSLWDQLKMKKKQDKTVEGYVVGALRNLCGNQDGFWRVTIEDGGVDVILGLLHSSNPVSQSNAASLLARLVRTLSDSISNLSDSGAVKALLQLLGEDNDIYVRASAADALDAISMNSEDAKNVIRELDGIRVLIGVAAAPCKEFAEEENGRALQHYATQALANVCGGMSALIIYLGGLSLSPRLAEPVADILGALAYALRIFDVSSRGAKEMFDPRQMEGILIKLLKPLDTKLIQERILQAMASLYGNLGLSKSLNNADSKRVLVGLTNLATENLREHLITCLSHLCRNGDVWEAIGKREGIQMLISLLGLSSERHQEHAVEFLAILTDTINESKWAVTSAGGIPPLVQMIETAVSNKARENAICVLWNLICHSEEIRACVERSGAIPAFLRLLKNGGAKSQETSANILIKLVRAADPEVIDQLLAMFHGDAQKSKAYVTRVLGHVLTSTSLDDFVQKGSAANNGLRSLVQTLASSNDKIKENAASVLADLLSSRKDLCNGLGIDENDNLSAKLLSGNTHAVAAQLAHALGSLSNPTKTKSGKKKPNVTGGESVKPVIKSAKISPIESAENPFTNLANMLSNPNIAVEAMSEDVVPALTRLLKEGSLQGKRNASQALNQLLKDFQVGDVFKGNDQCHFAVPGLTDLLNATRDVNNNNSVDVLEVISLLAKSKHAANLCNYPFSAFTEASSSLESLVRCLAEGHPLVQDKAIEILSRFCGTQSVLLGELLVMKSKSIGSLASRIMNSTSTVETRVGGAALLICAAKNNKKLTMEVLDRSGHLKILVSILVDMTKQSSRCSSYGIETQRPRSFVAKITNCSGDPATLSGCTVAVWLLSIICSSHPKNRLAVIEAGGLESISERLKTYISSPLEEQKDIEGTWICALFLAIIVQEPNIVLSPTTTRLVPTLARLMKSAQMIDRYFTAQALVTLVRSKNRGINVAIGNSCAIDGLISSIGYPESEFQNLFALSEELSLVQKPCEAVLEGLFEFEEIRHGSTSRKCIPLLVDLLRPNPDKPGAPLMAVKLLTRIADGHDSSKLLMAEAGALDALAKYLSLGPQDATEVTITELLRILFSHPEIARHEAAIRSMKQLIALLHLGSRSARLSATRALCKLFASENARDFELAWKAFQPLVKMLNTASESEKEAALAALVKLTSGKTLKMDLLTGFEGNPLENVYKILSSDGSLLESKTSAAKLCYVMLSNEGFRKSSFAVNFIMPLISLIRSDSSAAIEAGVAALDRLLDDKQNSELAAEHDVTDLLVGLASSQSYQISEATISCLVKLAKDKTPKKLEMIKLGIINQCLVHLSGNPPSELCSVIAELFRVLTNVGAVARSQDAVKMVEPLLLILLRQDLNLQGQHGALQAIVNVLEKPQNLESLKISFAQIVTPLILVLESPALEIQQLAAELLTCLLEEQCFQEDITTGDFIFPLVRLSGIRMRNLQERALKALEESSVTWPKEIADAEGLLKLSNVIIDEDPRLPVHLWESAAIALCNILRSNPENYYSKVTPQVLVRMLFSAAENTMILALDALIFHKNNDESSVVKMAEAGAIDALLDLIRSHHCEELSARLLESILNNQKVREMKICRFALTQLSEYILDPQTTSEPAKLLAAIALGDLSQHEGLARITESASACHALISLLEENSSQETKMVALCALQNFLMHSRTSRRAVVEARGTALVQELLVSCNAEVTVQAAIVIRLLFANHTLQDYVSQELVRSLTAALERELWATTTINVEVVKTLNVVLTTFPKLRTSEAATDCIPHLIGALKSSSKEAQEAVIDTLYTFRRSWPTMPIVIAKSQAILAADAIPVLQIMKQSRPRGSFHQREDSLLLCLPGCLTVTVNQGDNLKQTIGRTNAFCKLMIEDCDTKQTQVVKHSTSPVWKETFTWDFAIPPRGQLLHIVCKSKNMFRKRTLGKVTIPIDKALTEGICKGSFNLRRHTNTDGTYRSLDIEIVWSNPTV